MSDPFDLLNASFPEDSLREARGQLSSLDACIRALEQSPRSADALDEVYRAAHSLKSEPASVRVPAVQRLAPLIQDAVREIRGRRLEVTTGLLSLLRSAVRASASAIAAVETGASAVEDAKPVAASLERLIREAREVRHPSVAPKQAAEMKRAPVTVALFPQDPERISIAFEASRTAAGAAADLSQAIEAALALRDELGSRIKKQEKALKEVLDALPGRLSAVAGGEPVTVVSKELAEKINTLAVLASEHEESLAASLGRMNASTRACMRAAAEAGNAVSRIATVPVSAVLGRHDRAVAEAAARSGKKVSFSLQAGAVEVDASLAGVLSTALRRCVRLAVENGIDSPRTRKRKGKSQIALLTVFAREDTEGVMVALSDDGGGLSPRSIRSADASIGAGLRRKGGGLEIDSDAGKGTKFTLRLPCPRAGAPSLSGLVVKAAGTVYAVPEPFVQECVTIEPSDTVGAGECEGLKRGGETLPVHRLGDKSRGRAAVIVRYGGLSAALLFDAIMGSESLFPAPIAHRDARVPGMLDAGIRGDGSVALILDVPALLQKAAVAASPAARRPEKRKR